MLLGIWPAEVKVRSQYMSHMHFVQPRLTQDVPDEKDRNSSAVLVAGESKVVLETIEAGEGNGVAV